METPRGLAASFSVGAAVLFAAALLAILQGGCSEALGPDAEGCFGWYQGFYVLSTPESLYVRVELDFTWGMPDSAWIMTPLGTLEPDRIYEHEDPPGVAVAAVVEDAVSGWYSIRALYSSSARTYEEHVVARDDALNYDFGGIWPQRGEIGLGLTPTVRWPEIRQTQARVRVYADSLREKSLFDSGGSDDADSLRIPAGVLEGGTLYFWTLELYDWQDFVPDCSDGYYYMDFFDNGILYVGWFTTSETARAPHGEGSRTGAGSRQARARTFPSLEAKSRR